MTAPTTNTPMGTVTTTSDGVELRLKRVYPVGIDRVWAALTESDRMAEWMAPGEIALTPGGRVHIAFGNNDSVIDSQVVEIDPPRLLAYRWISNGTDCGLVRFQLTDQGDATVLTLTHETSGDASEFAAGWHTHLDMLAAAFTQGHIEFWWDAWEAHHAAYALAQGASSSGTSSEPTDGTLERRDDLIMLRFDREYPVPVERVWAALTEAGAVSTWLASDAASFEPGVGGSIMIPTAGGVAIESIVTVWDPPHRLVYGWDSTEWRGGEVTWELSPSAEGTHLVFTHAHPVTDDDQLAKSLSGWHTLLGMLGGYLAGTGKAWDMEAWHGVYASYQRSLG